MIKYTDAILWAVSVLMVAFILALDAQS